MQERTYESFFRASPTKSRSECFALGLLQVVLLLLQRQVLLGRQDGCF